MSELHSADRIRAIHAMVDHGDVGIAFQPIVEVRRRRLHAYEALARRTSEVFSSTPEMFQAAVQAGRVAELGRLHRDQAIRDCTGYPLFINVDPHEFDFGWLVRPDDPLFRHRYAVTVEITESVPIKYFSQCHSVLAEIRRKGVSLAIDDLGAGFSNIKYISDLEPEIVKLDRELVAGLTRDSRQFRLLKSLIDLCRDMEAQTIAEGVETETELEAVIAAGVDFAQGYVFGMPACPPPDLIWPGTLR
ncbi:MAG: EAL domain-containing protein [Acidobacteria bacterium]|nr:EAL domain-containing protein [Acidobacteriota bacterium]MCB9377654.1 EAL domain-containing protein [Holophagales bacterium]